MEHTAAQCDCKSGVYCRCIRRSERAFWPDVQPNQPCCDWAVFSASPPDVCCFCHPQCCGTGAGTEVQLRRQLAGSPGHVEWGPGHQQKDVAPAAATGTEGPIPTV